MSKALIAHLEANPHLETVFLNDNNEWQFHKRPGYDKEVSAQDVIENGLPDSDDDDSITGEDINAIKANAEETKIELEYAKEELEESKAELEKLKAELAKLKVKAEKPEKPAKAEKE